MLMPRPLKTVARALCGSVRITLAAITSRRLGVVGIAVLNACMSPVATLLRIEASCFASLASR